MPYTELEQFLGRGEEKVIWLLSYKNIAGLIAGGVLGHRVGRALGGEGGLVFLCTILGAMVGIALTFQHHGLLILRRLTIRVRFYLQRAVTPRTVDAAAIFAAPPPPPTPIRVSLHDGTPLIVPQMEQTP